MNPVGLFRGNLGSPRAKGVNPRRRRQKWTWLSTSCSCALLTTVCTSVSAQSFSFTSDVLSLTLCYKCCCCCFQLVIQYTTQEFQWALMSHSSHLHVVPLKSNMLPFLCSNEEIPFASLIPFQTQRHLSWTEQFMQTKVGVDRFPFEGTRQLFLIVFNPLKPALFNPNYYPSIFAKSLMTYTYLK